MGSEVNAC
jgi:hypothetical protein